MPPNPRPVVFDGLWRCLCPSYQPILRTSLTAGRRKPLGSTHLTTAQRVPQSRWYNGDAGQIESTPRVSSIWNPKYERKSLVHLPTVQLYEHLRADAARGRHWDVMNIIKILIKDRRERPNVRLYAAILHSFVNPEDGTAGKIRKVMEEMSNVGVDLDAGACHSILEALAVHPDYVLREEVLAYMKERWFTLSDTGHSMVVAGMLRDRLFEQAVEKIEDMVRQRIVVAGWLWDKTMWSLLEYGEVEDCWHVFVLRQQHSKMAIAQSLWMHFLDCASRKGHVEAVNTIWDRQVFTSYLRPPTNTCLNVLNIAGRTGNVKLATDVFRVLAERDTKLTTHHYELLLEAYINANDLENALSVVCIMAEAGLRIDESCFASLYVYLKEKDGRPLQAFSMLQAHESSGKKVPTAAINACLQASIQHSHLEEAVEMYKALHTVSKQGPNTQTFNILFQGCHRAGRMELAMFLASEMAQLGIEPDILTYDRLILVCCHANKPTEAFMYYEEMRETALVPRRGCFEILIAKGLEVGDERTPGVLRDMRAAGFVPKRELARAVAEGFRSPRFDDGAVERDFMGSVEVAADRGEGNVGRGMSG